MRPSRAASKSIASVPSGIRPVSPVRRSLAESSEKEGATEGVRGGGLGEGEARKAGVDVWVRVCVALAVRMMPTRLAADLMVSTERRSSATCSCVGGTGGSTAPSI